jgi:septal ring-binding cell division protein DamX
MVLTTSLLALQGEVLAEVPGVAAASPTVVLKPAERQAARIHGSDWLATRPAGNYTLQLLAVTRRESLDAFVAAQSDLQGPFATFEQQRGTKRLFVLLSGSYPSRAAAQAAALQLPESLQPWIRDFAAIREVMAATAPEAVLQALPSRTERKDTAWLWSRDPAHYTIQLAAADDEATLDAMLAGLSLPLEVALLQVRHETKERYLLLYGAFASSGVAVGEAEQLAVQVRGSEPSVRRFAELQDEVSHSTHY